MQQKDKTSENWLRWFESATESSTVYLLAIHRLSQKERKKKVH